MPKNKVKINVNGIDINLISDETQEYVFSIAAEVDREIVKVKSENPGLSTSIAYILVMMDFCDRMHKAEDKLVDRIDLKHDKKKVELKKDNKKQS